MITKNNDVPDSMAILVQEKKVQYHEKKLINDHYISSRHYQKNNYKICAISSSS
jgi:hypothetical protein